MTEEHLNSVVSKIREQYQGELRLFSAEDVEIIARMPDKVTFARFRDMLLEPKTRGRAFGFLVESCLMYPSREEYNKLVDSRPGIPVSFADKISELAGAGLVVEEKKL